MVQIVLWKCHGIFMYPVFVAEEMSGRVGYRTGNEELTLRTEGY